MNYDEFKVTLQEEIQANVSKTRLSWNILKIRLLPKGRRLHRPYSRLSGSMQTRLQRKLTGIMS